MIGRFAATRTLLALALAAATCLVAPPGPTALAQNRLGLPTPGKAAPGRPPAPPAEPPAADPVPGGMALPADRPVEPPAPIDRDVVPAAVGEAGAAPEAEAGQPSLPGATAPPGGAAPGATTGGDSADPFYLRPDRLPVGKQQVKLSVEVRALPVINLGKEASVRIIVNNDGTTDAYGVSVVYQLPDGLEFVSSEVPETKDPGNPQIFYWTKAMMAAGGEWSIGLKVKAIANKACEHVAHVTAKAGSRANTMVQEPKLKVEVIPSPTRILKGGQVKFEVFITNVGNGPARSINVQALLSEGLKVGEDDRVEQTIDVLKPGERYPLDVLMVDTVAGGQQTCTVEVRSPDVNVVPDEHRIKRTIEVTKPDLQLDLAGQDQRYTGQPIEYKVTVTNVGTAPAKAILVSTALPQEGGRMRGATPPVGATFSKSKDERKLFWKVPQLDPGQKFESSFIYETSTPRLYRATAEVVSGQIRASKQLTTNVEGMADLDLKVKAQDRVVDVGKSTYYDFVIQNLGTKEATKIQLRGTLVNLKVVKSFIGEATGQFEATKPAGPDQPIQFVFPEVKHLPAGGSMTLSLEVEAIHKGIASAEVDLAHEAMGDDNARIKGVITTKVTDNSISASRPAAAP